MEEEPRRFQWTGEIQWQSKGFAFISFLFPEKDTYHLFLFSVLCIILRKVEGGGGILLLVFYIRASLHPSVRLAYHILHVITVRATVLKFHMWIHHQEIADPFFLLPFWNYVKYCNKILSARYLRTNLSQGLATVSA